MFTTDNVVALEKVKGRVCVGAAVPTFTNPKAAPPCAFANTGARHKN
jgi:hypothetical protein